MTNNSTNPTEPSRETQSLADKPGVTEAEDRIAKDIGRKCADDVSAAIKRNMHLMSDRRGMFLVAVYGAVTGIAAATGAFAATLDGGPEPDERMIDEIWAAFFRPLALGQLPEGVCND